MNVFKQGKNTFGDYFGAFSILSAIGSYIVYIMFNNLSYNYEYFYRTWNINFQYLYSVKATLLFLSTTTTASIIQSNGINFL